MLGWKGTGPFLKDRLIRLGIPLVFFYFVLAPISTIGYFMMPASLTGVTVPLSWQVYPYILGMGPMWFVAMLLVFSFGYVAWRKLARNRTSSSTSESSLPGYPAIGLFILALALASYLLRFIIPLGQTVLDFPTLAYLPQYLSFFVLGAIGARRNWFQTLPGSMGKAGFAAVVVATITLFSIALASILAAIENGVEPLPPFGYGTWQSAVYALWDSIFAVGMTLAAITFFRRFFSEQGKLGRFLSRHSYTVYIIHSPIVVFVAIALRDAGFGNLLKFGIAVVIVVPACFAAAYLVRKIPLVSRIL